jgi:hypothetical protein
MDICGPFPVLTPHKQFSFLSILEDCMNFGFVGLLVQRCDAYEFYCQTEANVECVSGSQVLAVCMNSAQSSMKVVWVPICAILE